MSVKPADPVANRKFIGKVRAAMYHLGWLIPVTDEQLEAAEQRLDTDPIDSLPDLQNPYALFRTAEGETRQAQRRSSVPPAFQTEPERLAYAAREGQSIPDDIRDKMRRDRNKAEDRASNSPSAKED